MQRFSAANKEKSIAGNSKEEDDDVALLLSGEDGELSFSPSADDVRLLLQHAADADASDIGNQEGCPNTQVLEEAAARSDGNDRRNATTDADGFTTPTSVSRGVTDRPYPRFHQPIGYVALPMVDVHNTDIELGRGQSIVLSPISTEEDAKAVKRFARCLTIALIILNTLYMVCVILYLVYKYTKTDSTISPSPALNFVPITCGLFIGIGCKIAREAVAARKKRLLDDARCYAYLAIFFVCLGLAGSAGVLVMRVAVITGSTDNNGIKTLFG